MFLSVEYLKPVGIVTAQVLSTVTVFSLDDFDFVVFFDVEAFFCAVVEDAALSVAALPFSSFL